MRVSVQQVAGRHSDMCVRTRCRTVDELVSLFGRYVEGNSLFVATLGTCGEGFEGMFTIALVDGATALRGRGVVEKWWTNADNRFRLPGVLIGVRTLTASSKAIFDRIRAERARSSGNTAPLTRAPVPLADILSSDEIGRWNEETLIGAPLSGQKVPPSVPIPPLPARTKSATIPPLPRTVTPLRSSPRTTPATAILKGTITRPTVTRPPITVPPIRVPPVETPPVSTIETPPSSEPSIAALHRSLGRMEPYRARASGTPPMPEPAADDASDRAPTIPQLDLHEARWRTRWWTRVLLVVLPIAGFAGGAALAETTRTEERKPAQQIPLHATIDIEGTTYSVDVVLTAQRR